jgi:chemotaxis signal transduction protein
MSEATLATKMQHGGVVFRVAGELCFLPASIAMKVMPIPQMASVPGGPLALRVVALVDGDMIPVVDVIEDADASSPESSDRTGDAMLVCAVLGESVGLVGIQIVATGRFETAEHSGEVRLGNETARPFDVAAVIARVREGRWAV